MAAVVYALRQAAGVVGRPTCIVANTVKGKGVSFMENKREWHGKAPSEAEYSRAVLELRGGRP